MPAGGGTGGVANREVSRDSVAASSLVVSKPLRAESTSHLADVTICTMDSLIWATDSVS